MEKAKEVKRKWNEKGPKEPCLEKHGGLVGENSAYGVKLDDFVPYKQERGTDRIHSKDGRSDDTTNKATRMKEPEGGRCQTIDLKTWVDQIQAVEMNLMQEKKMNTKTKAIEEVPFWRRLNELMAE